MSLDPDAFQTRRPTTHHDDGGDSVSVPMLQLDGQHEEQHDNPFQRRPQPSSHQPSSGHYNVMIPTVKHWPALFVQGVKATGVYSAQKLRQFQEHRQEKSSGRYEGLPTSSTMSSSSGQRPMFTFASKRQLKESGGRTMLCSGRRLTRILLFLCIAILIPMWIFMVPHTLKPYGDRDVWIRYFDHEEPLKIQVPLGKKVHVADVKRVAFRQYSQGYSRSMLEEGRIILIHEDEGKLKAGAPWVNTDWSFRSSSDRPILMVDPKDFNLYQLLKENLRCFSKNYYYNGQLEFKPPRDSWQILAHVLRRILEEKSERQSDQVPFEYIRYLREGFGDPKKVERSPDKLYYYAQKDERKNAWMKPEFPPMHRYNPTPDPDWWRDTNVNNNTQEEPYTDIVDTGSQHESDFL